MPQGNEQQRKDVSFGHDTGHFVGSWCETHGVVGVPFCTTHWTGGCKGYSSPNTTDKNLFLSSSSCYLFFLPPFSLNFFINFFYHWLFPVITVLAWHDKEFGGFISRRELGGSGQEGVFLWDTTGFSLSFSWGFYLSFFPFFSFTSFP